MALRAVTFDLWQTLLYDTVDSDARRNLLRVEVTARLLHGWGYPQPVERVQAGFEEARTAWARVRQLHTELSFRQKMVSFLAAVDPSLLTALTPQQIEELAMAHARAFLESPPTIAPDAGAVVRAMAEQGLRVGLISNTGVTPGFAIRRLLQAAGFGNLLSTQTYSDELGTGKPVRAAFQVTLHRMGVGPHEAVHIGDDLDLDVAGAKAAGMRVVLLATERTTGGEHNADAVALELREVVEIVRRWAAD